MKMNDIPKCKTCKGKPTEWHELELISECQDCEGSGIDPSIQMCWECGAKNLDEAGNMCHCAGDKDWCHGCIVWPE